MTMFVDLDRQFMPFQDEPSWELSYNAFFPRDFWGCESWDQILTHRRVVILAEAGAGKTAEMREKTTTLLERGDYAFYATVNSLARKPLRDALSSWTEQGKFDAWLASSDDGVIFVDSIDEARLNGLRFSDALSSLSIGLAEHSRRATVLVSCRVSDWRAVEDRSQFETLLGQPPDVAKGVDKLDEAGDDAALLSALFPGKGEREDNAEVEETQTFEPHIVALAPLTVWQAKKLAERDGITDSASFIAAVRNADAEALANRPQDLLSLTVLWKKRGAVGSKYEILKTSIRQRLRETNLDLESDSK